MKRAEFVLLVIATLLLGAPWMVGIRNGQAVTYQDGLDAALGRAKVAWGVDWEAADLEPSFPDASAVRGGLNNLLETDSLASDRRVLLAVLLILLGLVSSYLRLSRAERRLGPPALHALLALLLLLSHEFDRLEDFNRDPSWRSLEHDRWEKWRETLDWSRLLRPRRTVMIDVLIPRERAVGFLLELLALAAVVGLAVADRIFARWTTRLVAFERDPGATEDVSAAVAARARAGENRLDASRDPRSPS